MIIEGLMTTLNANSDVNFAPMGPIVDEQMTELWLRPFQTSNTYKNLKVRPYGVFHVTDDVLLIARAALDRFMELPSTFPAEKVMGRVLSDCCRWYEFEVVELDDSSERTSIRAKVLHTGRLRDMSGFNRAKHAVLGSHDPGNSIAFDPRSTGSRSASRLEEPGRENGRPSGIGCLRASHEVCG